MRSGRIEKITRDHSPVGEREDAQEISESDAMRHPRRNEVYRDVGSEPHQPDDPEFVDVQRVPFESDAAFLLCSDGLTDLVPSATHSGRSSSSSPGDPQAVARALVAAANEAGGKDNVTVVYVEGEEFAPTRSRRDGTTGRERHRAGRGTEVTRRREARRPGRGAIVASMLLLAAIGAGRGGAARVVAAADGCRRAADRSLAGASTCKSSRDRRVDHGGDRAGAARIAGDRGTRRVPRAAAPQGQRARRQPRAARCDDSSAGDCVRERTGGFRRRRVGGSRARRVPHRRRCGDAVGHRVIRPRFRHLGCGHRNHRRHEGGDRHRRGDRAPALVGSDIHDNPGAALAIRTGATPRISQNVFTRNSMSERASMPLIIERGAVPQFLKNVFYGISPDAFASLDRRVAADAGARKLVCRRATARASCGAGQQRQAGTVMTTVFHRLGPYEIHQRDRPRRHGRGVSRHRHAQRRPRGA